MDTGWGVFGPAPAWVVLAASVVVALGVMVWAWIDGQRRCCRCGVSAHRVRVWVETADGWRVGPYCSQVCADRAPTDVGWRWGDPAVFRFEGRYSR